MEPGGKLRESGPVAGHWHFVGQDAVHVGPKQEIFSPWMLPCRKKHSFVGRTTTMSDQTIFMSAENHFWSRLFLRRPENRQSGLEYLYVGPDIWMSADTTAMSARRIFAKLHCFYVGRAHMHAGSHYFQLGNELKHGNDVEVESPS